MKLFANEVQPWHRKTTYQHHFRLGDVTGLEVYAATDPGRKFFRLSTWWRKKVKDSEYRQCVWSGMIGVFIGSCNYFSGKGIELFCNDFGIGVTTPYVKQRFFRSEWHHDILVYRIGWFGFKFKPPKFVLKRRDEKYAKQMEEAAEYYGQHCKDNGWDQE